MAGAEGEPPHPFTVFLREADFLGPQVQVQRYEVSEQVSNAYGRFARGEPLDDRAQLQRVDQARIRAVDGTVTFGFLLPPSSVSLVEFMAE
jgi:hypothetical protein